MRGSRFYPSTLHVRAGQLVSWVNSSFDPHTVSAYPSYTGIRFESGNIPPLGPQAYRPLYGRRGTFTMRFTSPGTYYYYCRYHQRAGMRGVVVVH